MVKNLSFLGRGGKITILFPPPPDTILIILPLATKEDIRNLEQRIDRVQLATKEDMRKLEEDIRRLELGTKEDIRNLDIRIDKVEQKVNGLKNELTVRLGGIVIGSSAVLGALMTIFAHVK